MRMSKKLKKDIVITLYNYLDILTEYAKYEEKYGEEQFDIKKDALDWVNEEKTKTEKLIKVVLE